MLSILKATQHRGHHVSGTSTPFATGRSTPSSENVTLVPASPVIVTATDSLGAFSEKPSRRPSYGKAVLVNTPSSQDGGLISKEHTEQGQVKFEVYMEYTKSASLRAFFCFLLAMIAWSATNLLANFILRSWGEENRTTRENSLRYVMWYGLFSLLSAISGGLAIVILMVYCTLRSTRYLHDSVRSL
jgi:ATP-binding cassette subfamily C (CFTR/MRP) protein 1